MASTMKVIPVACLADNYAYLVVCEATGACAVVDPSEEGPVVRAIDTDKLSPLAIWNTHHHPDHTGGNEAVVARYAIENVTGYVSDKGRIPGQTRFAESGERFKLGELDVEVSHIPGHTLGAIAYTVRAKDGTVAVFTGDTMFHAGCGRLFEGTPAQMHASLQSILALGDEVRVYPGHEYTVSNLRFAQSVEPSNGKVADALAEAQALRAENKPTVGTNLARERETNPFVRTRSPEIRRSLSIAADADDVAALAAIREAKNVFRGRALPVVLFVAAVRDVLRDGVPLATEELLDRAP